MFLYQEIYDLIEHRDKVLHIFHQELILIYFLTLFNLKHNLLYWGQWECFYTNEKSVSFIRAYLYCIFCINMRGAKKTYKSHILVHQELRADEVLYDSLPQIFFEKGLQSTKF